VGFWYFITNLLVLHAIRFCFRASRIVREKVKCIVHSFCCEAAYVAIRPFLVKKLLPKFILEISQPRTEARKIRYICLMYNWYSNPADRSFCVFEQMLVSISGTITSWNFENTFFTYYLSGSGCNTGPHIMICRIFSIFRKQLHEMLLHFVPDVMLQLILNSIFWLGALRKLSVHNYAYVLQNHRTVLQSTVICQEFHGILRNKTFISVYDIGSMCIKTELNSLYIIAKIFVTLK